MGPRGETVYRSRFASRLFVSCLLAVVVTSAIGLPAASADTAEPTLIASAWYWEQQQNQEVDTPNGKVVVELSNPYCPSVPGAAGSVAPETCAENRLPVEVINGDYEAPDKISALTFDLSMVPLGSEVKSFKVTLLEAEAGCRESSETQSGQQCEQTNPQNIEGHEVQACEVTEIFGDGEARLYKEIPKYTCSDTDPVGKRKEIENDAEKDPDDTTPDHIWTFDLTSYAQAWAETPPLCTCIMLFPVAPKGDGEGQNSGPDSWRVIMAGPKVEKGVVTKLVFEPAENPLGNIPTPESPLPTGTTGTGGTTGGFTTETGSFGGDTGGTTSGGDLGGGTAAGGDSTEGGEAPVAAEPVGDAIPDPEAMPGYVWLAILAGLVGWSMVRSVILERSLGHRSNGVLAQIHQLNRGGGAAAAATASPGPWDALRTGFGKVGGALNPVTSKVGSAFSKMRNLVRR